MPNSLKHHLRLLLDFIERSLRLDPAHFGVAFSFGKLLGFNYRVIPALFYFQSDVLREVLPYPLDLGS